MKNTNNAVRRFGVNEMATYQVDIARGASHIASCLTPLTRHTAILEVSDAFLKEHGKRCHSMFLDALASSLISRGKEEAAHLVRELRNTGVLVEPAAPVKPGAGRRRGVASKSLPARPASTTPPSSLAA